MQRDRLTESAIFSGARGLLAGVVLLFIMGAGAGAVRGAAGDFDPQFAGEGWTGGLAAVGGAMDMAVQPDGKIVVAGTAPLDLGGSPGLSVWRFTPDGVPDVSFNGTGQARIEDSRTVGRRVMLRPDGRILIGGTLKAWDDPAPQYILAAFLADWAKTGQTIG